MYPLCVAFPRTGLTPETVELYHSRLSRFTIEQLSGALNRIVDESKFFPTIAEIREVIREDLAPADKPSVLLEHRPDKEEAARVLAELHLFIKKSETIDAERQAERIRKRKELLRRQAEAIGALDGKQEKTSS